MPANWTTWRLLCCAVPELENEKQAFHAANARFGERVTLARRVLFALVSPFPGYDPRRQGHNVESNIRFCDFFVQLFGEGAAESGYVQFVDLSIACTADPAFPMRSTVALFRNPQSASPEMSALRRRLIEGGACQVLDFHNMQEFDALADNILAGWYAMTQDQPRPPDS